MLSIFISAEKMYLSTLLNKAVGIYQSNNLSQEIEQRSRISLLKIRKLIVTVNILGTLKRRIDFRTFILLRSFQLRNIKQEQSI